MTFHRDATQFAVLTALYAPLEFAWVYATSQTIYLPMLRRVAPYSRGLRLSYAPLAYVPLLGAWHFLVMRHLATGAVLRDSLLRAVSLFLAVYAVYNATNMVTFSEWDLRVAALDVCWGITVAACVTVLMHLIHHRTQLFT
jgi:uncharacterized membrane protein